VAHCTRHRAEAKGKPKADAKTPNAALTIDGKTGELRKRTLRPQQRTQSCVFGSI